MSQVTKLIIPAAGIGTRMLPITKSQPKEMLPVLDKPVIQYIVENAVQAGITDIIFVTGPTKKALEDHFDRNISLEQECLKGGKDSQCHLIRQVSELANFIYVRQKGEYGTGTPVLNCRHIIGDEPFAVCWGDEIIHCPAGKPHLKQLIEVYDKYTDPVLTGIPTDDEGTTKYGIIEGLVVEEGVLQVNRLVEKPGPDNTTSRIGSIGGYILTPDIFDILETMPKRQGREVYLTDAIDVLRQQRPLYAKMVDCLHYDTGNKLSWLKTNVAFALRDPDLGDEFKEYLKSKI